METTDRTTRPIGTLRKAKLLLLLLAVTLGSILVSCAVEEVRPAPNELRLFLDRLRSSAANYTLSELEEVQVPERNLIELAQRLRKVGEIPLIVRDTPYTYEVGDSELFWALNTDTNEHFRITAILREVTPHLYVWVEEGAEVDLEALRGSAERFEVDTYPTTRRYLGEEWSPGVDGDVHLNILHTHGLGSDTAGYFAGADEVSTLAHPFSNEREMFYANLDVINVGSDYYDGLLAHEFQHMIHWQMDRNEELWLSEGLSKLATLLNGYDPGSSEQSFLDRPDVQLNSFSYGGDDSSAHYGAAYLFVLYLLDRFGEEATRAVVAHSDNGSSSISSVLEELGEPVDFETLFGDWAVALFLDDPSLLDGRYGFESLDINGPTLTADVSTYPAAVVDETVHQFASDYVRVAGTEPVTVVFTGTQQVPMVSATPHSGSFQWWSNRGDDIDTTLTRFFDFAGLSSVTLDYWLWYEIEQDWDYAYLEVSADGGQTWDILAAPHTSEQNPTGNNYGHGYTGVSGDGEVPQWIHEQVDLGDYAGQSILLRFEYITDGAIHYTGLALDDLSIVELGYHDGFEAVDPAWEAAGFVRNNNRLPQRFIIQLVELGPEPQVSRLPLNELGSARWTIPLSQERDQAIIVVSGATPVTLETASYDLEIVRER